MALPGATMGLIRLQQAGYFGIPVLTATSTPCAENTQAHFATVIQIWIETNGAAPCRHQVDTGAVCGIT